MRVARHYDMTTTTTYRTVRPVVIREQPHGFGRELGRLPKGREFPGHPSHDPAWVVCAFGGYVERARLVDTARAKGPARVRCTRCHKRWAGLGYVRCDACRTAERAASTRHRKRRRKRYNAYMRGYMAATRAARRRLVEVET